jgi:hypothetical protein
MAKTDDSFIREAIAIRKLSIEEIRARYLELFGEETKSRNKDYLFKRIAYRLQERKHGGLTAETRARAEALADQAPMRRRLPPGAAEELALAARPRDPRLPPPGTVLCRKHEGVEHTVTIVDDGFEYHGERFRSLSVVASKIAGTRWNGYGFFGLLQKESA